MAINDAGQIVGMKDGSAYLLTPLADEPPSISIGDVTVAEGNANARTVTFTVSLSAAVAQGVTVAYSTGDGTGTADNDYQSATDTVTFAPGETTQSITILVYGDRIAEPHETFLVNLSNPINATMVKARSWMMSRGSALAILAKRKAEAPPSHSLL
jgi:hypothetical protein